MTDSLGVPKAISVCTRIDKIRLLCRGESGSVLLRWADLCVVSNARLTGTRSWVLVIPVFDQSQRLLYLGTVDLQIISHQCGMDSAIVLPCLVPVLIDLDQCFCIPSKAQGIGTCFFGARQNLS